MLRKGSHKKKKGTGEKKKDSASPVIVIVIHSEGMGVSVLSVSLLGAQDLAAH